MRAFRDGEYHILSDGWIKIANSDYAVGLDRVPEGRMLLGLNQLLLYKSGKLILIDTGLGEKWNPRELSLLDYQQPRRLMSALDNLGVSPKDVDVVIFSHLHYDHSGGGTRRVGDMVAPTFPNAVYYVNQIELNYAEQPAPESIDDYRVADFEPLKDAGILRISADGEMIVPGVSLHHAPGHSPGHQVILIELEDETVLFTGDLISTRSHANLKVTMVYDDDRELLLRHRRHWIESAIHGNWKVVFCHAVRNPVGFLASTSIESLSNESTE